ncbi:hypothetical protein HHI36_021561 [Cryptolaemus montrouzieri]|uniref:FYVE-type domain-containing protein n=1 Tax=Cryptolaemus montrouzieri TaxID=559131 RepID=A0ABD2MY25_9CUCU
MEKYAVDLDKVLNDFEYSEYSSESAKLNKNVQDAIPNTSTNSHYSIKNDTVVKHSMNNVFHSLNEYLSSEITPKKNPNEQKSIQTPYILKLPQETAKELSNVISNDSGDNYRKTEAVSSEILYDANLLSRENVDLSRKCEPSILVENSHSVEKMPRLKNTSELETNSESALPSKNSDLLVSTETRLIEWVEDTTKKRLEKDGEASLKVDQVEKVTSKDINHSNNAECNSSNEISESNGNITNAKIQFFDRIKPMIMKELEEDNNFLDVLFKGLSNRKSCSLSDSSSSSNVPYELLVDSDSEDIYEVPVHTSKKKLDDFYKKVEPIFKKCLEDNHVFQIPDTKKLNLNSSESKSDKIRNDDIVNKESGNFVELEKSEELGTKIEDDRRKVPNDLLVDIGNSANFHDEINKDTELNDEKKQDAKGNLKTELVKNDASDVEKAVLTEEEINGTSIDIEKKTKTSDKSLRGNGNFRVDLDEILVVEEDSTADFQDSKQGKLDSIEAFNKAIEPVIISVGFENDFTLDEENLDQYFDELEQELGDQVKEAERSELEHNEIEISVDESKLEEKEEVEVGNKNITHLEDAKTEINEEDSREKEKTFQTEIHNEIECREPEEKSVPLTAYTENEEHTSETPVLDSITEVKLEEKTGKSSNSEPISKDTPEVEVEKNCRPQHLVLKEKSQDTTRKINLIGSPGSTPYNNVYSTKEFQKNNLKEERSGDTARPVSPTYSDVSTDSISSGISDGVAGIEARKNTEDAIVPSEETIQNNLISSGESSKNDVTTDKDFKNNLRTIIQESVEPSRSNVPVEDIQECSGINVVEDNNFEETVQVTKKRDKSSVEQGGDASNSSLGIDWLGKQAPLWIPDNDTMSCLHCDMKFTVIKRRHHCRACGLVLCSKCCNSRYRLEYLDADARVCKKCYDILNKDTNSSSGSEISQESSPIRNLNVGSNTSHSGQPNPNNPLEYCSTVPPLQQVDPGNIATPSVMVPVGVLKREGSTKCRSNKSVMFCDGIRPGSDLTNLDTDFNYSDSHKADKGKKLEKSGKIRKNLDIFDPETRSFIPSDEMSLPPTVTIYKTDIKYSPCTNTPSVVDVLRKGAMIFALQPNVFVHLKIINMDCCVNKVAWCFSTEGLINVGQDEIVILLELMENESLIPKDIFIHLNKIYLEAVKGSSVKELGLTLHTLTPFLGSKNHAGFVYIRPTFQCLQNVIVPKEPYLIGILIHRWETPWAKLFPLRLVLRLGAEYKYYPSPIISTRERDSVFVEIGHTIINLLADFRNFSYTLPQIRGLTIHMEDKNTTVTIPVNRYDQVLKGLCNSSDHILALAGNFSTSADSHLVCIQDTLSATNNYSTHAINICNQPRKVTGASFIVFNGALKSTSGLTAKSNIVEDGLMIQILPEHMLQVRESLKNMKDHTIKCGCVNEESDETVTIVWGEADTTFNVGVLSPIDNKFMTGIPSIRVHNGKDYPCNSGNRLIRWTEVFIIQSVEESSKNQDSVDISKISESIAKATCQALVKYLDLLVSNSFYKIGLRVNLHVENVSYSAGSNNVKLPPIYMKSLDNELIPVLHRITSNNIAEKPIILELIFRILNI